MPHTRAPDFRPPAVQVLPGKYPLGTDQRRREAAARRSGAASGGPATDGLLEHTDDGDVRDICDLDQQLPEVSTQRIPVRADGGVFDGSVEVAGVFGEPPVEGLATPWRGMT